MYKRIFMKGLIAAFLCIFSCPAWAYDFVVNGIYYNITSSSNKTVEVTYGESSYSGTVTIPATVTNSGTTYSVTGIGAWAFQYCSSLTSVTIGSNVTSIGYVAFGDCYSLESIDIPNSVETIGDFAFYRCSGLASATFGNGLQSIGYAAFGDCTSLESIDIPNSVESIGDFAFYGCTSLASVILDQSVSYIGEAAFDRCSSLASISLPASVTSLGDYVFELCTSLAEITVAEDNPTYCSVDNVVFTKDMQTLVRYPAGSERTEYEVPEGVTAVLVDAFCSTQNLTTLTMPSTLTDIGVDAFESCQALTSITTLATTPPTCGSNAFGSLPLSEDTLYVPKGSKDAYSTADTWSNFGTIEEMAAVGDKILVDGIYYTVLSSSEVEVTHESSDAWAGTSTYVGTVTIPETISYGGTNYNVIGVGYCAFYGCTELTSIVIGNKVTYIGEQSFNGCSGLTGELKIPESVTEIVDYAFMGCSSLASLTLGENVTSIGTNAFNGCSSLEGELTIPDSVKEMGVRAFAGCTSLTSLTIGSGLTTIEEFTFEGCKGLESVVLGENVTTIGDYAFSECLSLASITLGEKVTTIGSGAFNSCSSLTEVTLSDNVSSIGYAAFSSCSSLQSIAIPDAVTSIEDYTFDSCTSLTSATLGNSVKSIGYSAFYDCTSLESIVIPDCVESIDEWAFAYCTSLQEVTLGNSVESIGYAAFAYCTSLQSFTSLNPEPPTCDITAFFGASTSTCILYVPEGSVDAYSSATGWSDFAHILQIGEELAGVGDKIEVDGLFYNILSDTEVEVTFGDNYSSTFGTPEYTGSITIPETAYYQGRTYNVVGVGQYAFSYSSLSSVDISASVTYIDECAFYFCDQLTSVYIPASVKTVGDMAFGGCSRLLKADINCDTLEIFAFSNCGSLEEVYINCVTIGKSAFANASAIEVPTLTDRVETIESQAFYNCWSLTTLNIPASVASIAYDAFEVCTALKKITVADENETYCVVDNVLFTKDMQTLVRYPASFDATEYEVPEGVTAIGGDAFCSSKYLTTLTLPATVTSVGIWTFEHCTALKSITSLATTPPTCGNYAFSGLNTANITLIVPDDCVEVYSTADTWKDFYVVATGINGTNVGAASEVARYSLDGKRLSHPQRGMNIVVYSDGSVRKVNVK